jgi:hypothetical protein
VPDAVNAGAGVEGGSRLPRLCGLLVAVLVAWLARPVIEFDFVEFDDGINLVFNRHLGPLSRETIAWAFTDMDQMRRYVPLGWLGCAAVYGVAGLSPAGYHAAGALLQVVNSVLVYAILLALLRRFARETPESWRAAWALLGALGWALHPLRAETLGWASGLFYGLAAALALGGVLAYLRAWQPGAHRGPWVAVSAALVCASTLTYPMSLGVAAALVLLDFALAPVAGWPERRRLLLEKAWFVVPTGVVIALTLVASYTAPAYWVRPPAWEDFGPGARLLQAAAAWGYYLWRPWWPFQLTPVVDWLYDPPAVRAIAWLSLIAGAGISAALVVGGRRWRGPAVAWFAHAVLLAPLLGFFERPYFPADRYHLLAGVVLAAGLTVAAARAGARIRIPVALAAGAAVTALAVAQQAQLLIWADTDTLFARIVAQARHPTVKRNYQERWVGFHQLRGRPEAARTAARRAGLDPESLPPVSPGVVPGIAGSHLTLAREFTRRGRLREAHEHLEAALVLAPDWRTAAYHLALLRALDGAWLEGWQLTRRTLAAGRGEPVTLAGRQRLLLLVAEGAFAAGQARSAAALVTLARRESGDGSGATAELERDLQAAAARYEAGGRR